MATLITTAATITFTKILPMLEDEEGTPIYEPTLMTEGNTHITVESRGTVDNEGVVTFIDTETIIVADSGNYTMQYASATEDGFISVTGIPLVVGRNKLTFYRSSEDSLDTSGALIYFEGKGSIKRIDDVAELTCEYSTIIEEEE